MKKLYAPWRSSYIKKGDAGCPFCSAVTDPNDEASFVLYRGEQALVMLNRYPYNAGHILVIPHQHKGSLADIDAAVRAEIMELATITAELLKKTLACHGINMGFNFGSASGGSIPEHLHMHVLPRWHGDTNFLTTLGETKLISFDLHETYQRLREAFAA